MLSQSWHMTDWQTDWLIGWLA